jgi:uncharacterized protein YcnI
VRIRVVARALAVAGVAILVAAPMASAHVEVSPEEATRGGFAELTFRVPNEMDNANTTQIQVAMPENNPIAGVSVKPVPGWTYKVDMKKLSTPIKNDDGDEVGEVVGSITWSGGAIRPGEYQDFDVSVGPLPETDSVTFPAIQTYSNGQVVRWIDPSVEGQPEPEHPVPTLKLTKAGSDSSSASGSGSESASGVTVKNAASKDDVSTANTLAIVGIAVGALGLLVGGVALLRSQKSAS